MTPSCFALMVAAVLGAEPSPVPGNPTSIAVAGMSESFAPATIGPNGCGEPRFAFNAPSPWIHGYTQEIPAYAGFHVFRPYNYKHVLVQSQMAAEWGLPSTSPYSQQFWHFNKKPTPDHREGELRR
jgi:hypothetical protein